jgi:hypothetical protein
MATRRAGTCGRTPREPRWVAGMLARATNPPGQGHVALRMQVIDGRGNTVEQTIIRAYHIGQ